jgi:hypothetical protein
MYTAVRAAGCSALLNWQRYANDCNGCELRIRVFRTNFETPEEGRAGRYFMRFGEDEQPKFDRAFKVTRNALGIAWSHGKKSAIG